jgi:hypothetical protein
MLLRGSGGALSEAVVFSVWWWVVLAAALLGFL